MGYNDNAKNDINSMCMLSKIHIPSKNRKHVKFYLHGIIGSKDINHKKEVGILYLYALKFQKKKNCGGKIKIF